MIAPCQRWGDDQEDQNLEADSPSASLMGRGAGGFSPVSGRTRGWMRGVAEPAPLQAPLQQAKE